MKKTRKKKAIEVFENTANPELRKQAMVVDSVTASGDKMSRVVTQVPLDYYLARGYITEGQHKGGDHLFRNFVFAGLSYTSKSCIDTKMGQPPQDLDGLKQQYNIEAYRNAIASIQGTREQAVAIWVCCLGCRPSERPDAKSRDMHRLKSALTDLAKHYRYE